MLKEFQSMVNVSVLLTLRLVTVNEGKRMMIRPMRQKQILKARIMNSSLVNGS